MSKSASFSIDDAFQESEEDKIRLYDNDQEEDIPLQVMTEEQQIRHTTISSITR